MSIVPKDEEVKFSRYKYIMSRTDTKGNIQFANDYFLQVSGYDLTELVGKPHNIIRHPDMPKTIFKLMWDRLKSGNSIYAVVKNLAKDGRYYWVTTEFDIKRDPSTNEINGYMAFRQMCPRKVVDTIEPIYAKLLEIESEQGLKAAELYFNGFLDSRQESYDQFVENVAQNKGAMKIFFAAMKKFFS